MEYKEEKVLFQNFHGEIEVNCEIFSGSSEYESQFCFTTDGQSASLSWNKAPPGAYDQIFITV
jgi:hypothetical protein